MIRRMKRQTKKRHSVRRAWYLTVRDTSAHRTPLAERTTLSVLDLIVADE